MNTFGSPAQLATFLGFDADEARCTLLLQLVSDAIRATLQQDIDQVVDDVVILTPEHDLRVAFLPQLPVTEVSLVEQGSNTTNDWRVLDPANYHWSASGVLTRRGPGARWWSDWSDHCYDLRVTYTHGYEVVPDALVAVAIAVAARMYENPIGATAEAIGGYSVSYGKVGGITFTDYENETLGRYDVARIA